MRIARRDLLTLAAGAAVGSVATNVLRRRQDAPGVLRLEVQTPADQSIDSFAIAPDGSAIAYCAQGAGRPSMFLRRLDRFVELPLAGTEGAHVPFFSPDGTWLGFFADGKLRKIPSGGGGVVDVCDAPAGTAGGCWTPGGLIVFAPLGKQGLLRVPAAGGAPEALTRPMKGEVDHGWPCALPTGGLIFTVSRQDRDARLAVLDRESKSWRLLLPASGGAHFTSDGRLAYALGNELLSVKFDASALAVQGAPRAFSRNIAATTTGYGGTGSAGLDLSSHGTLAYLPRMSGDPQTAIAWITDAGQVTRRTRHTDRYETPRVSPDGRHVAVAIRSDSWRRDIWLCDARGDTRMRLTDDGSDNHSPAWTPTGQELVFASNRSGAQNLYVLSISDPHHARQIHSTGHALNPAAVSSDGRRVLYYEVASDGGRDIWLLDREGGAKPVVSGANNDRAPALSVDGSSVAYVSNATGRDEIYVTSLDTGTTMRISEGGGTEPVWSRSGRDVLYRQGDSLMRVDASSGHTERLFEHAFERAPGDNLANYDIQPDGQIVMIERLGRQHEIRVVVNWIGEL